MKIYIPGRGESAAYAMSRCIDDFAEAQVRAIEKAGKWYAYAMDIKAGRQPVLGDKMYEPPLPSI